MTENFRYVVCAPGQGWIVDDFIERGKVPVDLDRIESQGCPRGKIFMMADPEEYLTNTTPAPSDSYPAPAEELIAEYDRRHRSTLITELIRSEVERSISDPKTLHKIAIAT